MALVVIKEGTMRTKQPHYMRFGPPMPVVPVGDFSKMGLTEEQWADAWSLCGPSAQMNMKGGFNRPPLQIWQVIAAAYLEGLQHGAALERERSHGDGQRL